MPKCKCYSLPYHEKFIKDCKCECHAKPKETTPQTDHFGKANEKVEPKEQEWEKEFFQMWIMGTSMDKIKNFIRKLLQQHKIDKEKALQQQREEICEMVERIHTKHYMKWIPTEEQMGYRRAQMDILKIIKEKT